MFDPECENFRQDKPFFKVINDKEVLGDYSAKIEFEGVSAYLFGELAGGILGDDVLNSDEYLARLESVLDDREEIEELVKNAVGSFYLVIVRCDKTSVYVSMSAPSLIFFGNELSYSFYNEESVAYRKHGSIDSLDRKQLMSHCFSHQILLRTPFSTLFTNLNRLPSGCYFRLGDSLPKVYLWNKSRYAKDNSYKRFKFVFENTVDLLCANESEEIKLLFSGGIDSSVLLAALRNKGRKVEAVHIPYSGIESPDVKLAEEIAAFFKVPFRLIDLSEADKGFINKLAFSGPGTVVGPQYLKSRLSAESFGEEAVNLLSGQNADTLYHVDTYAPSSSMPRLIKWLLILLGIKKRVYYSSIYLDKSERSKFKWRLWPFSLNGKYRNESFSDYVKSLSLPMGEHVSPFHEEPNRFSVSEEYKDFRKRELFLPLWNDYKASGTLDWDLRSIKVFRWFRTVFNVSVNYKNNCQATGINRIIPYNEGPLANFLLDQPIGPSEVVFVKAFSYRYFKESVGVSYDSFISRSRGVGFSVSFYWSRLFRKISMKLFKSKVHADKYTSELDILRDLVGDDSYYLCSLLKDERSIAEIKKIYDDINVMKGCSDKNKMMLLCRVVNMHLFVNKLGLR